MKILFVDQSGNLYGSERGLLTLLGKPWPDGFEPVVICPNNSLLWHELQKLDVPSETMEFGGYGWLKRPDWQLTFLFKFMGFIKKHQPDAIVINFEGNVPLLVLGSRLMNCPVIRMLKREVRSSDSSQLGFKMGYLDRLSFLASSGVICISGAVEKQLRDALGVAVEFPAITLFDPQDIVSLTSEEIQARRSSFGLDANALVIGEFARVHPAKGMDVLVKSAPIVLEKLPNVRFLIVGDTDGSEFTANYRRELEQLTRDLGVADCFIWTGFVPDPLVVMAACDLTVLPSRAEGLGRVVLESWAVERAVIASDVDGPVEVIRLSGGGLLHPVDDHLALADRIIELCTDSALRMELAKRGNLWVQQCCSSSDYRSQFIQHVKNFIHQL